MAMNISPFMQQLLSMHMGQQGQQPQQPPPQQQGQGLGQTMFGMGQNMLGFNQPPQPGQQQPGMPMNILPPVAQPNTTGDLGAPQQGAGKGGGFGQSMMRMFMGGL